MKCELSRALWGAAINHLIGPSNSNDLWLYLNSSSHKRNPQCIWETVFLFTKLISEVCASRWVTMMTMRRFPPLPPQLRPFIMPRDSQKMREEPAKFQYYRDHPILLLSCPKVLGNAYMLSPVGRTWHQREDPSRWLPGSSHGKAVSQLAEKKKFYEIGLLFRTKTMTRSACHSCYN